MVYGAQPVRISPGLSLEGGRAIDPLVPWKRHYYGEAKRRLLNAEVILKNDAAGSMPSTPSD